MRIIVIVQARAGSSRLPLKTIQRIAGKPMLAHVLERAKAIHGTAGVVLATSHEARDTPLTWIADEYGVLCCRGDEHDVLGRFAFAAVSTQADVVVRLTGDCPLIDPAVCEQVIADYCDHQEPAVDYVSNDTTASGFPDGTDCEVMSAAILLQADREAKPHASWVHGDREHVTPWIRRHAVQRTVRAPQDWSRWKLSVDRQEDLAFVRKIHEYLDDGEWSLEATIRAAQAAERA